ncbi:thioredoxin [Polaromonas sp. SM01]|uniref:thioredoxin n=1 Tax=Polaromonas sp. SM01 TaxID=3085630 RepID=UPI00298133F9|nr:thioredoxin [Polaromonas sp. SM01]MDW5441425.1 thioredoxin [Polaromonas sp. SM01]
MIDVTIHNFEEEVVAASMTTPVLIDFWAPWCGPCKSLGPILEKVEVAYGGRFKLVKIDSDQEQQLGAAFGIKSIPTCILMINGQPVDGFAGALPEGKIKEFLDKHLPPADELPPEEEAEAPEDLDPAAQLEKLQEAVATDPANDNTRFDYIRLLLQHGQVDHAQAAFATVADKAAGVRKFEALRHWFNAIETGAAHADVSRAKAEFDAKLLANKRDFDTRYALAQLHMSQQHWVPAMDELLEILMRDKSWNEELARKTFVSILEIIEPPKVKVADGQIPPDDPTVATYRRRLSSVVLS